MYFITLCNIVSNIVILSGCAFMVCEKNAYVLFGNNCSTGTCLTDKIYNMHIKKFFLFSIPIELEPNLLEQ